MTRGKKAASASARRAASSQERVAELEAMLTDQQASSAAEVQELKTEVQSLRGRLVSSVKDEAREEIRAARERADAEVRAAHEGKAQAMREVLEFLITTGNLGLPGIEEWAKLSEMSGVPFGEVMGLGGRVEQNRYQRRLSVKKARSSADARRQMGV